MITQVIEMAVPKKKVSYSRKRMRNSQRKNIKTFYTLCSICNHPKRMHHICQNCYSKNK